MKARRRRRGDAGFTLLEVLVALTLTGVVSLLFLEAIQLSGRALDRLSFHADRLDQRRSLEIMMRRAFAGIVPLPVFADEPGFRGRPTTVTFLSAVAEGEPGLYRIELVFERKAGFGTVVLTRRAAGRPVAPRRQSTVLARHFRAFDIAYFGAPLPTEAARWQSRWEGVPHLPKLVRIRVQDGDGHLLAPIVIDLRHAA